MTKSRDQSQQADWLLYPYLSTFLETGFGNFYVVAETLICAVAVSGASWVLPVEIKRFGNCYVVAETLVCAVAVSDATWVTLYIFNKP